jgi:hypothetical protein
MNKGDELYRRFRVAVKCRNGPLARWYLRMMKDHNEDLEDEIVQRAAPRGVAEIEAMLRDVSPES